MKARNPEPHRRESGNSLKLIDAENPFVNEHQEHRN